MILSDGKNQFDDNRFSFWEWSAPILQTPGEVLQKYNELKLQNRIVKDVVAVGMGYNWRDDMIEDTVYNALENMDPLRRAQIPDPDAFLPEEVELPCWAEIDEPLLIVFEDGDTLAVSFDEGSCVRMDLNSIPVTIEPGVNRKTFHANRLFKDLIGRRLCALEVTGTTQRPEFTYSYGLILEEQPNYIGKISFVLTSDKVPDPWRRLEFNACIDYGHVSLTDYAGRQQTIPAKQALWVTEGYLDPEERA